ncbi:putative WRKY transcription factor 65 [Hibiscus syriacus]|uniref:WRKY transcription factor 65 n=1 Tax=Hibiscus syriacus TaxID=106335 RepID=A0A6A2Z9H3_HIBSY|nr:probable WRKY transcription factor 65 [Hibiscus syriacus]KAE8688253.1 putative WRKY transcription factor 65 [Hibiscus syriacus]
MDGGDGSFNKTSNPYATEQELEDDDNVSSETGAESPPSTTFNDTKLSPKKGRSIQKRVVSVPIKDVEGSRYKGESAPPSDSWAWRKYGQKPIKGSPYPRGYYRCSSSKGCPARKQVERSRVDPKMLVITYSCEHNHPWPTSRNNGASAKQAAAAQTPTTRKTTVKPEPSTSQHDTEHESGTEQRFADLTDDSILTTGDEFPWFGEMETTSSTVLESPIFTERDNFDADLKMVFPMKEEDESLFADLGELPECSFVFGHQRNVGAQVGIC